VLFPATGTTNLRAAIFDLKLDQLAGANFPTGGWGARVRNYSQLGSLGAEDPYNKWSASAIGAVSAGRHTFEAGIAAGGKWGTNSIPVYDQFELGGFLKLSGLAPSQIRTQDYEYARLGYRTKLAEIPLFEGMYFGAALEVARAKPVVPVWKGETLSGPAVIPAGALYVGIDSPIGPLYLGYGYANRENTAIYLFLGRP
jgi:NTE family protein